MNIKNLFKFVLVWVALLGVLPAMAQTWRDIKVNLMNGALLTEEEVSGKTLTTFGIAIAEDGTVTRVESTDATAVAVVEGKYHSNEHGWNNFKATTTVPAGAYRISMGTCAWGGDVKVTFGGTEVASFNTNNGTCYHGNTEANFVSAYYVAAESGEMVVSGGNYAPYFAIEAIDASEIPNNMVVTYGLGDTGAEGILPADVEVELGTMFAIPVNRTLYVEGKTLAGWTDGTTTYALGQEVKAEGAELALTPVFTANTVSLADRTETVTITWDFQRKNGAPTVGVQGKTMIWVAQAVVNGKTIDVKMPIDATNGKVANGSWNDWAQLNGGTVLTIPACKGTVVSLESYSATTTTTIAGDVINQETTTPTYTYEGTAETIDIVIGDGSYWRTVKVVLPVVENEGGEEGGEEIEIPEKSVEIGTVEAVISDGNLVDINNCRQKEGQLIDSSYDGSYVTFIVNTTKAGEYLFTSMIGTTQDGTAITLGYLDENGEYVASEKKDIENSGNWNQGPNYTWKFNLEANKVYTFKILCHTANGSGYCVNLFAMNIGMEGLVTPEYTVSYSVGDAAVEGTVPAAKTVKHGQSVKVPKNTTLYVEGKTLTEWTDGTNTYKAGDEIKVETDLALTAVFADNEVNLADRKEAVTVKWNFGESNGAGTINAQGKSTILVAQATVNGKVIDVKMNIDATNGKANNVGRGDTWAQVNKGTILTIPSCKDAVVSVSSYGALGAEGKTATTIGGSADYTSATTVTHTVTGAAETADIVVGDDAGYLSEVSVALPVVENEGGEGGEEGGDEPVEVAWKDIAINLSESAFLDATEKNEDTHPRVSLGLAIAEDGTMSRVAADDATANIVLEGCWWNSHGWSGTTAKVKVDGPVKIGIGGCQYAGHTIKVTDAAGNEVASFAAGGAGCWEGSKADDLISYAYYTGEATTLTINIPSYCPYLSVEKVTEIVQEATVTYSLGDAVCEGTTVPAAVKVVVGDKVVVPANFTLYVEGKTLTGWTDGTNTYAIGAEIAPTADMTLTPVFTENTVSLADREDAVTVKWDFQQKSGAPIIGWQATAGHVWVAQATVNGKVIDVKCDIDVTNGKVANANWNDWAQMNGGTKFTIPSCKGAVVSMEAYSAITTTTIDGQSDYASGTTINYTIANTTETIDVVIGDGSYYRYIQVVLPFVEKDYSGTVFENAEACVTWPFNSTADYATAYTSTPEGAFGLISVNTGDLEVTGTGKRTAGDGGIDDVVFLKLKPSGSTQSVEWGVKPAKGLTFTPTKVSGYIQRFGTDAENGVTVTATLADGTSETLGNFTAPRANKSVADDKFAGNSNSTHQFVIELTADQQAKLTSADGFTLSATVGVGPTKEGGFSDIRIYGTINGTIAAVEKFAVTPAVNIEEAGSATIYPVSDKYDNGTEVTLTATDNFGYNFVNWTNAAGEEVSTDAKFVWTVGAEETLTANFVKVNTYALDLTVEEPANDYMVQWNPAPTVVGDKKMYEEGTKVVLTTSNNYIMNFAGWSNDETASEIVVDMTQDVTLTAKYEANVDFIAGWDFILRGSDGRVADFAAADNDAAQLVLRDAEGNTSGWLDKSQEAAGGYEGKPAAVNWRNNAAIGTYYYQIKVNAEAFTNIKVYAEMLYNYNAYQKQDVEYSLDNENWTLLGSIQMPGVKTWTPGEFALPAEADNQKELYIRWKADTSSKLDGTASDNDGTCITNIYVTGTMKLVDDGKAPVLVSTTPKEGATNASANGKVVLSFDEKVKVAEGAVATLNGVKLSPTVSGKSVMFEYKSLEYSTEYTFTLPANSISDLTDNAIAEAITVKFSTKTKPAVTKALYDFIVPDDGNFKEALEAAAARADKSKRYRIFVKRGAHIVPGNENAPVTGADGKNYADPKTYFNTPNVSIIGEDMAETSIANYMTTESFDGEYGPAHPLEGIRTSGLLYLQSGATNTYFEDITLKSNTPDSRGRNVVLVDGGNKTICKDVCLWAYQDTYVSDRGQSLYYFEGGVIRGRTDFICGSGDVFFNGVDIIMCEAGGYIVAPRDNVKYGYVFKNCTIKDGGADGVNGKYYLGRPWTEAAETYFIDCVMEAIPSAGGWTNMSAGGCTRFAEYNSMTASGTPVDLSGRVKELGKETLNPNSPVLSAVEAAEIGNMTNMFGDWDPTEATEQASAPANVKIENSVITWDNSDYVLLWAICKDGKVIDFTTEPTYTVDDATATYSVRAANEMGGLGEATVAVNPESIEGLVAGQAVLSTEIFNLNGVQLNTLQQGVNIIRKTYANGAVIVEKNVVK